MGWPVGQTKQREKKMANRILVTGAAGRVGAVGRMVTELLLKQGKSVRAMVRNEDERAKALRDQGAEVVVGDLLDLDSMNKVIAGCETMYFLEGFFLIFTSDSVRKLNQIRLPFGEGKTSPVAAEDVARVVAVLLADPQPHVGKIYHLTGPQSHNMYFYAQEYSKALCRTITYQDIPVEPWRDELVKRGLPVHLVNHLATMADMHRAGRYDRMSNDVLTLTGQGPLSVQDFVRKNAAIFTSSAKET
jgi:uncharacterized protein YbjT (DUF2867 family)